MSQTGDPHCRAGTEIYAKLACGSCCPLLCLPPAKLPRLDGAEVSPASTPARGLLIEYWLPSALIPFAFPLLPLIPGFPVLPRLFTSPSLRSFFPFLLNSVYLLSYVACHVPGTFLTISEAFSFAHHGQPMYLLPRPVIPESLFFCSSFLKRYSKEL